MTISSVRPAFNTPPCYEPRGEEAQERGREEESVEPVWSESAVNGTGASILDPTASSTASEPTEASEAGELAGTEQVESAISCETAPRVAGDTAEARSAVKPRNRAERRRRAGRGEGCRRAGRGVRPRLCRRCIQADRSESGGRSSGASRGECCRASRGERRGRGSVGRASRRCLAERNCIERASRRRIAERSGVKRAS